MDWIPVLPANLIPARDRLVAQWTRGRTLTTRQRIAMRGAAARYVLHGPPPTPRQILGYRTAKRKREWAAMFPGVTYPGRHGQRKPKAST